MREFLFVASLGLIGCSADPADPPVYDGYVSDTYRTTDNWLCHADDAKLCDADLDTSIVAADGTVTVEEHTAAADPPVDCFYVYPTVSNDADTYSDLVVDAEEEFIAINHAARLNRACRVFAPVYRQLTVTALLGGEIGDFDLGPPYADVLDAFKHYIAQHNGGRGFVLVGHSQGSRHLHQLIREEIETTPELAERMIAAYLIGTTVRVPAGRDVGGDFVTTSACRTADQLGCVVSYASYRATAPPVSATSIFGETGDGQTDALCNSPAALGGGSAPLGSIYPTGGKGTFSLLLAASPFADPSAHPEITTPFFAVPGLVRGECVNRGEHQYLEVSIAADPNDARADEIEGDLSDGWGLHLADMHLAMGDIVDLLQGQATNWLTARGQP